MGVGSEYNIGAGEETDYLLTLMESMLIEYIMIHLSLSIILRELFMIMKRY